MNKISFLLFIQLLLIFELSFSLDFKYDQKVGRKLRFKNQVIFDIYQNKIYQESDDQMNKAVLEITAVSNGIGVYNGKYFNYGHKGTNESYRLMNVYSGTYSQDERGKMFVSPRDIIPSTRSVPTFPTNSINIGDNWNARGEEVLKNIFDKNGVFKIDVDVKYRYLSNLIITNKTLAVISLEYDILYNPEDDPALASIYGFTHNLFYWDIESSAPYFYSEEINLLYTSRNGDAILYKGNSASIMEEISDVTNVEKANLMKEISSQVSSPSNGINIREAIDGIIVNLGNILFDINFYNIKKEFEEKLDKLAAILNQHPALDIVVSGHTDNTGTSPYNTILSENRAMAITDYLVSKGVVKTRISYMGYGPTKPIADNSTASGRTLNRRVEIKIITKE
jgi:outer membrane protein OmpA-like peptidoglycan-associated protein